MADYERRNGSSRGSHTNRKRRMRDEDEYDRRPQRRRFEEAPQVKVRKQLLGIAESPLKKTDDEVANIAKTVGTFNDDELRNNFLDLVLQLVVEQPFKIPFAAAIIVVANPESPDLAREVLARTASILNKYFKSGLWREVKLVLRFLACLQGILEGDGVFPILEELFSRAVDLQTASSEDSLGLELVKIILLTIPHIMASSAAGFEEHANALLEKTDVIASTPHALEALVDPYPGSGDDNAQEPQSVIGLLQNQLQGEASQGWQLSCIPRPWKVMAAEDKTGAQAGAQEESTKHALPQIIVPSPVSPGLRPRLPEIYFSVYADQDIETVPPTSNIASSILRDSLVDTINILDFNRIATAKFLIDLDCYFAPNTFVKRATPFDLLRDVEGDRSTWKPEDVAVDAVFSQLLQLPAPEHKLVYYHSVLTEACKIAPAAIAPSLGRAIRYLYKNLDSMDLELEYRFMDWFSHHLSNFGFTWKWTEWVDDVELSSAHPKKAFIMGALEKEIRLSFAQRIRGTLPEPYQPLISKAKELETPDFKYNLDETQYSPSALEILRLLRVKVPDQEIQPHLSEIERQAQSLGVVDPLVTSTDAYVTAICYIGSKSLSHVLSCIERCKERLLSIGPQSELARRQIITSVMEYWREKPGVGVNVVDKLLNYTILTPMSVITWALVDNIGKGKVLTHAHIYEMVASTMHKVTNRIRQIVGARNQRALPIEQVSILDETLTKEKGDMTDLFAVIEDALTGVAMGVVDEMAESDNQDGSEDTLLRGWGARWLRVFRRKMAVEEAWIDEMLGAGEEMDEEDLGEGGLDDDENERGNGISGEHTVNGQAYEEDLEANTS